MAGSARLIASRGRRDLAADWEVCAVAADSVRDPSALADAPNRQWLHSGAPMTAAAALRAAGRWSLDGVPRRFDADDWWYRLRFDASPEECASARAIIGFDGLATLAQAWLNGQPLLSSANMFVAHVCPLAGGLLARNELLIRFRSLDAALAARRPRPRWRAPMVEHQQLRWFRSSLLGRTPGWSPPAAPVGPWRGVWIDAGVGPTVSVSKLRSLLAGETGRVAVELQIAPPPGRQIASVDLELNGHGHTNRVTLAARDGGRFGGTVEIDRPRRWWPHTHGEPALYELRVHIAVHGDGFEDVMVETLGSVGFRTLVVDRSGGRFSIRVNDEPVFCRGASWTPIDPVQLHAPDEALQDAMATVCRAGMNMLRVNGTMVYEDDAFFDACDRQGVLVWQDLMFANMDYPGDDADFLSNVDAELHSQLTRWQARPSLAVVCGNSEVGQQAAMWGAPRAAWHPALFHDHIADRVANALPDVDYWPSSAHGGAFPHQADAGTTSYYGVGAYLRPLDDARRANLSFATECLAFANVPDADTLARMPGGLALRPHHPAWKQRTPRDLNAGWDFEDVRDHYLGLVFRVDPVQLRARDPARYLELARVATGEVMASAFAEWRRPGSGCGGALVWFLRDLWAGAGWGVLDDAGGAKASFRYLARSLQPQAIFLTDEGVNGLAVHVVNESALALDGRLDLVAYGDGGMPVARGSIPMALQARAASSTNVGACLDGWFDLTHAYRFGPPPCAVIVGSLHAGDEQRVAQAFHFPDGLPHARLADLGLSAQARQLVSGELVLQLESTHFVQSLHVDVAGYRADDDHFHLPPHGVRELLLRPDGEGVRGPLRGSVKALNAYTPTPIRFVP